MEAIKDGVIDIIIGTQNLLSEGVILRIWGCS
jgi:transcription-repair coupling factor (superfamily II helicase)